MSSKDYENIGNLATALQREAEVQAEKPQCVRCCLYLQALIDIAETVRDAEDAADALFSISNILALVVHANDLFRRELPE